MESGFLVSLWRFECFKFKLLQKRNKRCSQLDQRKALPDAAAWTSTKRNKLNKSIRTEEANPFPLLVLFLPHKDVVGDSQREIAQDQTSQALAN